MCLETLTGSEEAPAFGHGRSPARPVATGSSLRACFELFRRQAMPQNEVFRYGDRRLLPAGRANHPAEKCAYAELPNASNPHDNLP